MYLVSEPRPLLLVDSTSADNHETTLVLPGLPVARLTYLRCLVDEGPNFAEHAVVLAGEPTLDLEVRALVSRALGAARPTRVTFLVSDGPGAPGFASDEQGREATGAGLCAAAVCSAQSSGLFEQGESREVAWGAGLTVTRQGRFYSVVPR